MEFDVSQAEQCVLIEERDSILTVTINRPQVRNAVDYATAEAIAGALERLASEEQLSSAIITGAGGFFSSGMDLGAFLGGSLPLFGDRGFAGIARRSASKPVIAAVEGFAIAGGFEIALACDLIVAAEGARFAIPEVQRGLVAAGGALLRLPRRMPYHVAMELALTGDFITAERLHGLGIVNRLTAAGAAHAEARSLAEKIIAAAPLAIKATKRIIAEQEDWSHEDMWEQQELVRVPVMNSADAREGAAAFGERRQPIWQGR